MGFDSGETQDQKIRRLQLELSEAKTSGNFPSNAGRTTAAASSSATSQPMINMIRNGDHNHSVNTWFETAPSGGDKQSECANVYSYPPDASITLSDGAMPVGSTLTSAAAPFVASDVGKNIIVYGAGAAGGNLITTVASFISATQVTTAAAATTAVTNAFVRLRMVQLLHRNTLSNGAFANEALKDAAHSLYANADPDWVRSNGTVRIGSLNTVGYPFGYFNPAGTTFIPLHLLFPGRNINVRLNAALASAYIKPAGRIYFGIWNNHLGGLNFATGGEFAVSGGRSQTPPAASVSAQFQIICQTDQGYFIKSKILTLADYPTEASFSPSVYGFLSWLPFAGTLKYQIYRKLGTGNVYLLEEIPSGASSYRDVNSPLKIDTGSTSFPNIAGARLGVSAYVATSPAALSILAVNGVDANWSPIVGTIPFPSSVNLGELSDPILLVGLTETPGIEVLDAVANGTTTVTSIAAQFNAGMTGKPFTLTDPSVAGRTISGTVTFVSATTLTLSVAPSWSSTKNVLNVKNCAPRSVLFDLVGAAANGSNWTNHPEDGTGRGQSVASNPNGSTQGGSNPGTGDAGSGGTIHYPQCFLDGEKVSIITGGGMIEEICAGDLETWMRVFFGTFDERGNPLGNTIKKVSRFETDEIICFLCQGDACATSVTKYHRWANLDNYRTGQPASNVVAGDNLLTWTGKKFKLTKVTERSIVRGRFGITSIELTGDDPDSEHLFLLNGKLSHNRKVEGQINPL